MYAHTESAESLFQKELNRRGINSSSLDTEGLLLLDVLSSYNWLTGKICLLLLQTGKVNLAVQKIPLQRRNLQIKATRGDS